MRFRAMNTQTTWNDPVRAWETRIRESLEFVGDRRLAESLRHATNEALALAWTTPYPWLVLPVLLEEKLAAARRYSERQQFARCWSLELLRKMGWHDASATGSEFSEADKTSPLNFPGRNSSAMLWPVTTCFG